MELADAPLTHQTIQQNLTISVPNFSPRICETYCPNKQERDLNMRLQIGFTYEDLTKAWDGWFGMIRAFKLLLWEEASVGNLSSILLSAVFGCFLLLATAATMFIGLFALIGVQFLGLLERSILAGISQRRWQPTNELSPPT